MMWLMCVELFDVMVLNVLVLLLWEMRKCVREVIFVCFDVFVIVCGVKLVKR